MVKRNIGYTLVEMLVVIGLMAFIATLVFYGIRTYNNVQSVTNAQQEFISNLRAVQNKVNNGADGENYKVVTIDSPTQYTLDGQVITLPDPVTMSPSSNTSVCFANPNLGGYTLVAPCGTCGAGAYYACSNGIPINGNPATLTVFFTNGSVTKQVIIEGFNTAINRINAN